MGSRVAQWGGLACRLRRVPTISKRSVVHLLNRDITPAIVASYLRVAALPALNGTFLSRKTYATSAKTPAKTAAPKKGSTKRGATRKSTKSAKRKKQTKTTKTAKQTAAPKKKQKKKLDSEALLKLKIRELKGDALSHPKALPISPFAVYFSGKTGGTMTKAWESYSSLPTAEQQPFVEKAEQNSIINKRAHDEWIQSHTPLEIKEANAARRRLRKLLNTRKYPLLVDKRQVKKPLSAYLIFLTSKIATEDLKHFPIKERFGQVAHLWKHMAESEKQQYAQLEEEARDKYIQEYNDTYGQEPLLVKRGTASESDV
ncbi:hypothetical protein FQN57_005190 [Myotisia sp. PD_48]|nr:hypothetical protein FQN57_005190 [Myotisia sp. PD_48]